jgi:hypothetical protein
MNLARFQYDVFWSGSQAISKYRDHPAEPLRGRSPWVASTEGPHPLSHLQGDVSRACCKARAANAAPNGRMQGTEVPRMTSCVEWELERLESTGARRLICLNRTQLKGLPMVAPRSFPGTDLRLISD